MQCDKNGTGVLSDFLWSGKDEDRNTVRCTSVDIDASLRDNVDL